MFNNFGCRTAGQGASRRTDRVIGRSANRVNRTQIMKETRCHDRREGEWTPSCPLWDLRVLRRWLLIFTYPMRAIPQLPDLLTATRFDASFPVPSASSTSTAVE